MLRHHDTDVVAIHFAETGKTVYCKQDDSVLDVAEAHGIDIEWGCRGYFRGVAVSSRRARPMRPKL